MTELAGVLVGDYFLLECLSREGLVEMYRARPTTRGGYDVLLRLFRPQFPDPTQFRAHFSTEVEKVWHCHHESLIPLVEFGTGDDLLFCVTLMPEAETLEQFLDQQTERFLPIGLVLRLMAQLCAAVQCLHEHDIVHGNIQPSSIYVRDGVDALLTNLSMRHAYQEGDPLASLLDEGNAEYVAPEQSLGMVGPASDIYALGVLLYRLLTGRVPYSGSNPEETALMHTNEPIPPLRASRPKLPESLESIVQMALAKSPEDRFASADAMAQALFASVLTKHPQASSRAAFPEPTHSSYSPQPPRRVQVRSRRTPFTWTRAVSLLMLSMLLFGLVSASFFVLSLPQHIYDIRGHPFGLGGDNGRTVVAGHPPAYPPATVGATSASLTKTKNPTIGGPDTDSGGIGLPGMPTPVSTGGTTPIAGPSATPTSFSPPMAPAQCASGSLSVDGSPDFAPVLQQVANDYQALCPGLSISLAANGSRFALTMVQQGQIDMASSDVTVSSAWNVTDHTVVVLLYAVIVSPDVQVSSLSSTSLQAIYQGTITNWSQVGGPNEAVKVILRPVSDPVTAIFRAFVLNGQPERVRGLRLRRDVSNTAVQLVSQMQGAISYVPLFAVQGANVHAVAINGIAPSNSAVVQGTYPLWSVEHLYTQGDGTPQALQYVQFFDTQNEAAGIGQFGAVPINMLQPQVLTSHLPGPEI